MRKGVCTLVGGQYGSEGKGLILSKIACDYQHHVRVGAANAGHTLYDDAEGEKHVMQQLPCAAYAYPAAELYIGPGALISMDILKKELEILQEWRAYYKLMPKQVMIDYRAHVIQPYQIEAEAKSGLAERIGSTSATAREGIGIAQAERVMRADTCLPMDRVGEFDENIVITDVPAELARVDGILLEGTQGTGLSLTTGQFPYVTSRNTTSAGLAAECGVAPTRIDRVILVCRTYPIRVAGPSGPFHSGSREISWDDIDVDQESERTTVTKKVRRVATFSMEQVKEAVYLNGATELALTFADYLDPRIGGESGSWPSGTFESYPEVASFLADIEHQVDVPIKYLGTGPNSVINL